MSTKVNLRKSSQRMQNNYTNINVCPQKCKWKSTKFSTNKQSAITQ